MSDRFRFFPVTSGELGPGTHGIEDAHAVDEAPGVVVLAGSRELAVRITAALNAEDRRARGAGSVTYTAPVGAGLRVRRFATITDADVGRYSVEGLDDAGRPMLGHLQSTLGRIQPIDVGKRVYRTLGEELAPGGPRPWIMSVENDAQRDARLAVDE
jgi:hypothetical protein